jgi:hypothetical protein
VKHEGVFKIALANACGDWSSTGLDQPWYFNVGALRKSEFSVALASR